MRKRVGSGRLGRRTGEAIRERARDDLGALGAFLAREPFVLGQRLGTIDAVA